MRAAPDWAVLLTCPDLWSTDDQRPACGGDVWCFAHPHLVRAYVTLPHPHPILILETLHGGTLAHLIDYRHCCLALGDVAVLGLRLCSAVHAG